MNNRLIQIALSGLFASVSLALGVVVAQSAPVSVSDTYWGGTAANGATLADRIGNNPPFEITSATFNRIQTTNLNDTLVVTIYTSFAGAPNGSSSAPTYGAGYGALFLNTTGLLLNLTGTAPEYKTDVYNAGDWTHVLTMPTQPGSGDQAGTGGWYAVNEAKILKSNDYFGSSSLGYRKDQAVQYDTSGGSSMGTVNWAVNAGAGTITFSILDNFALGNSLAFSWAMTCANDMIKGTVGGFGSENPVPLPPALILFLSALGGMVVLARRRRQGDARLALNSAAA